MTAILFVLVLIFTVVQSATTKCYHRLQGSLFVFNAYRSISAFVPLFALSLFDFSLSSVTVVCALVYGVLLSVSMVSGYFALKTGPMALTSMLVSFSISIPVVFGVIFLKENLTVFKIIGLSALFAALIVANVNFKKPEEKNNRSLWFLFVLITFLTNGLCSVMQKIHQIHLPGKETEEFMMLAMAYCAVFFCAVALIKEKPKNVFLCKGKLFGVLSGVANAGANFCTMLLLSSQNASMIFPLIAAGTLILTLLCGIFFFKEKPKFNHYTAIALGLVTVVFLKI